MNDFEKWDLVERLTRVQTAIPAARAALQSARERMEAPFYVRAWHQALGHEGWGLGEELYFGVIVPIITLACLGLLYWIHNR